MATLRATQLGSKYKKCKKKIALDVLKEARILFVTGAKVLGSGLR